MVSGKQSSAASSRHKGEETNKPSSTYIAFRLAPSMTLALTSGERLRARSAALFSCTVRPWTFSPFESDRPRNFQKAISEYFHLTERDSYLLTS